MNEHDTMVIGHRAKLETEAFINEHLNDPAKGWPKTCLCNHNGRGSHQEKRAGAFVGHVLSRDERFDFEKILGIL